MRCFNHALSARVKASGHNFSNMSIGRWTLACLLLVAGFSADVAAAKERKDNPWLILPPGAPARSGKDRLHKDLGTKEFVSVANNHDVGSGVAG